MAATPLTWQDKFLTLQNVPLKLIAEHYSTPCYVYSETAIVDRIQEYQQALSPLNFHLAYAMKANSHKQIINTMHKNGLGFDIVSGGELERLSYCNIPGENIIFSGVGKTEQELQQALAYNIGCFNIESEDELYTLAKISEQQHQKAPIAIRVNPDIDAKTHPYISTGLHENKFGIDIEKALTLYQDISINYPSLNIIGIAAHIGSQLTELSPLKENTECLIALSEKLKAQGVNLKRIDIGGGLGIPYQASDTPPSIDEFGKMLKQQFKNRSEAVYLEPGRSLVAEAGVLLTSIIRLKKTPYKNFAIVDAAMTELMRPTLYNAYHPILPLEKSLENNLSNSDEVYDIVGGVCETGDWLGKDRKLNIKKHDLLAIGASGAYGTALSSNYNSRGRVPEIWLNKQSNASSLGEQITEREPVERISELERLLS